MIRKVVGWAVVAFLVFFVAYRPASAASATKLIGSGLADIATGFSDFFTRLVS